MPELIMAIDPGPELSAWVLWNSEEISAFGYEANAELRRRIMTRWGDGRLAIEQIGHYGKGMPAGRDVFDTCVEIGRFIQAWHPHKDDALLIERRYIKQHHCGSAQAKDANIRQALIDKYGAPGTKKNPGLTYGISKHLWQAFAVATYVTETEPQGLRITA